MKIEFTNKRNEKATITSKEPFLLSSFEGFGDVSADVQSQNSPYMDGSTYIDAILEERSLSIEFTILADSERDLMDKKRMISRVFNPKLGEGNLRYERGGNIFQIDCVAEHVPEFPKGQGNRGITFQKATVDLIAHDPYWRDPNQVSRALTAYKGYFTLPFKLPFKLGKQGDRTTLINDGDVPAPVSIDLQGPATNPQIRNATTGEFIKINTSIAADEILHIDTTPRHKRIEIYRGDIALNGFVYFDYAGGATFWQLEPGENDVEYYADSGNRDGVVAVAWSNRYVGI